MTNQERATATEKACSEALKIVKIERPIRSESTARERKGIDKIAANHKVSADHIKRLVNCGK